MIINQRSNLVISTGNRPSPGILAEGLEGDLLNSVLENGLGVLDLLHLRLQSLVDHRGVGVGDGSGMGVSVGGGVSSIGVEAVVEGRSVGQGNDLLGLFILHFLLIGRSGLSARNRITEGVDTFSVLRLESVALDLDFDLLGNKFGLHGLVGVSQGRVSVGQGGVSVGQGGVVVVSIRESVVIGQS